MQVTTKRDLFFLLRKSRLLSTAERVAAREVCQGLTEAREAAKRLVSSELLTSWQAAELLAGHSKFFLGKYRLLKLRGRGSMGVVYKAEHRDLKRIVAVKVLPRSLLDKPRSVSRFLREIRSTAILNHPNLVVAYDADAIGDTYCLVMEYISGKSLKVLCAQHRRLPATWVCECIRQAALGLQHIHERGLVHRDVKPSNLLVTSSSTRERPQVKLLDIGLARFVSEAEEDQCLTRDGQIVGTGDYMAPEQVSKAKQADIRADIYGLGATLYFVLARTPPLAGKTLLGTYMNRLQGDPPLLSSLCRDIPPTLDAIVAKMLKRDPQDRYQTPDQVAADLAHLLAHWGLEPPAENLALRTNGRSSDSEPEYTAVESTSGGQRDSEFRLLSEPSLDEFSELMEQSVTESRPVLWDDAHRSAFRARSREWMTRFEELASRLYERLLGRRRSVTRRPSKDKASGSR